MLVLLLDTFPLHAKYITYKVQSITGRYIWYLENQGYINWDTYNIEML